MRRDSYPKRHLLVFSSSSQVLYVVSLPVERRWPKLVDSISSSPPLVAMQGSECRQNTSDAARKPKRIVVYCIAPNVCSLNHRATRLGRRFVSASARRKYSQPQTLHIALHPCHNLPLSEPSAISQTCDDGLHANSCASPGLIFPGPSFRQVAK